MKCWWRLDPDGKICKIIHDDKKIPPAHPSWNYPQTEEDLGLINFLSYEIREFTSVSGRRFTEGFLLGITMKCKEI